MSTDFSNIATEVFRNVQGIAQRLSDNLPNDNLEIIQKYSGPESSKIIGLPPISAFHTLHNNNVQDLSFEDVKSERRSLNDWHILASSTVLKLRPAFPNFSGLVNASQKGELFSLNYKLGSEKYKSLLKEALQSEPRFITSSFGGSSYIQVAVLSNYNIADSFQTQYTESQLEATANSAAMMGAETTMLFPQITSSMKGLTDNLSKKLESIEGLESGGVLDSIRTAFSANAGTVGQIVTGAKVDFPQIWSNSSYTPSYQFTTMLYNPWPDDPSIGDKDYCYNKFIVEPLAHLLAFMMPISIDGISYNFPLLCSAYGGGIFNNISGFIESFDINMGGAASDISFRQRPNVIEITFSIKNLYSTMIGYAPDAGSQKNPIVSEERPTFRGYINSLKSYATFDWKESNITQNLNLSTLDTPLPAPNNRPDPSNPTENEERLNIIDEIKSSNPSLNVLPPELLSNTQSYERDVKQVLDTIQVLSPEMDVALRIVNGLPLTENVSNWFWNNLDKFSPEVQQIVAQNSPEDTGILTFTTQREAIKSDGQL